VDLKTMRLSKIGEFGLIKCLRNRCEVTSPEILKGIGDDAAAIKFAAKKILITSDMLLEGIHFDLSFTTFYQLGYKVLAVNISDIFAMGGNPKYFLLNLGVPKIYDSKDIHELYSGIMKIAKKFGVVIVGGDTCASRQGLMLSGTLIGYADRIIMRSGANIGDGIFVTDTLGDSAMGLMILKKLGRKIPIRVQNEKCKMKNVKFTVHSSRFTVHGVLPLLKRHLMPEPQPLKDARKVTSMIDVSDGLLIDLSHICDESKVGAIIYKKRIPVSRELVDIAKDLNMDPIKFALTGGEDYVLLFTAPPHIKTKAVRIGEIIKKGRFIVDSKGGKKPFKAEGYEHFK
jgi:thiamine-monophosphate kinase